MDYLVVYFWIMLFLGVLVFCSMREHLLNMLLSLEFIVLVIFIYLLYSFAGECHYYSLIYLIMTVCEGSLGLSLMVMMGRCYGSDYFSGLGFLI